MLFGLRIARLPFVFRRLLVLLVLLCLFASALFSLLLCLAVHARVI